MKKLGTTIRPELSERNKYWIPKQRYYELKHFCLQYPSWKEAKDNLLNFPHQNDFIDAALERRGLSDPTERMVEGRDGYTRRMTMVESAAALTDRLIAPYILECVTDGISFDKLNARTRIPCSRDQFYDLYRKFFWILNDIRE